MRPDTAKNIWYAMSQCWVDHPIEDTDFQRHLDNIDFADVSISELNHVVRVEVCSGFAMFTLAVLLTMGMVMPDWFFPESQVDRIQAKYHARNKLLMWINPLWILGVIIAQFIVHERLRELTRRSLAK